MIADNFYPDLKVLIGTKEWATYKQVIKKEIEEKLMTMLYCNKEKAEDLRMEARALSGTLKLVEDFISEYESRKKEGIKK